jgi:hypothetical protein
MLTRPRPRASGRQARHAKRRCTARTTGRGPELTALKARQLACHLCLRVVGMCLFVCVAVYLLSGCSFCVLHWKILGVVQCIVSVACIACRCCEIRMTQPKDRT